MPFNICCVRHIRNFLVLNEYVRTTVSSWQRGSFISISHKQVTASQMVQLSHIPGQLLHSMLHVHVYYGFTPVEGTGLLWSIRAAQLQPKLLNWAYLNIWIASGWEQGMERAAMEIGVDVADRVLMGEWESLKDTHFIPSLWPTMQCCVGNMQWATVLLNIM